MVQLVSEESGNDSDPQEASWVFERPELTLFGVWTAKRHRMGEDAEPTLLHHLPTRSGLLGVYDGLGGSGARPAGATGPDRQVSNAFVASRLAHLAVREWFLERERTGETLQERLHEAFRLAHRNGPKLRGTLSRELPTTIAVLEYRLEHRTVRVAARWAGDSRCFVLTALEGLQQVSRDDTDADDALEILIADQPMTNYVSADAAFRIRENILDPVGLPCLLLCATDGFFNYVSTPAMFEYHVLDCLTGSADLQDWAARLAAWVRGFASDDATLAVAAFGFENFAAIRDQFLHRRDLLHTDHREPMAAAEAEAGDQARRSATVEARQRSWDRYRPGYSALIPGRGEGAGA